MAGPMTNATYTFAAMSLAPADAWVETAPGVSRAVLSSLPDLMLVAFRFKAGAVGALHSHPHVQASFVAEGSFDVTIDGSTTRLARGATFIVASNRVHGVVAIEDGLLIDAFTPQRDDFLQPPKPQ